MSEGRFGTNADVHGILLLDKPLALTSAAAVARLKRLFCARKTGHTGSLDPLATGFLAICFGEATKFGAHLLDADKTYRVTVRLGERTPSGDQETAVCERQPLPALSAEILRSALAGFPAEYEQMPPMHSALKHGGKPLYSYARAGITLDRVPRKVAIYGMQMLNWNSPDLCFDVHCSKGTYIRVLAEDIAARLSTIGHLTGLRRLSVAPFEEHGMVKLEALESMVPAERWQHLLPVDEALRDVPRLDVDATQAADLRLGRKVDVRADCLPNVRIYGPEAQFLGLGEVQASGRLMPRRLICSSGANRA